MPQPPSDNNHASRSSDHRNSGPTSSSALRETFENRKSLIVKNNRNARRSSKSDTVAEDSHCVAPKLFETNETAIMSGAVGILSAVYKGINNENIGYIGEDPTIDVLSLLGMQRISIPHMQYAPLKPDEDEDHADFEALKRQLEALESYPRLRPTRELQLDIHQYKKELKM